MRIAIVAMVLPVVLVACGNKAAAPPDPEPREGSATAAPVVAAPAGSAASDLAAYVAMNLPISSLDGVEMPAPERDRLTAIIKADPASGMLVTTPGLDLRWAHALAGWPGKVLVFANLTELPPESARELAQWHGDSLVLIVKRLDPAAAAALASWPGKGLYLDGTALDAASATALAKFAGATLGLAHVEQSPEVVQALAAYHGAVAIALDGPKVAPTGNTTPPAETDEDLEKLGRIAHAVDDSDLPTIKAFLASGGPVDMNERGTTLLMEATNRKQLEPAKLLVAAHASVNATNASGLTPLYYALDDSSPEGAAPAVVSALVHLLVEAGADVSPKDAQGDMYRLPLAQVAARGDVVLAGYLLSKGADAAAAGPDEMTALIAAIDAGHADMVALLIKKGAGLDPKSPAMGMSPIHQAILMGAQAVSGATYDHASAAQIHALQVQWRAVLDAVLAAHPDLGARDARGQTPLEDAIRIADLDTLAHFLDAKPDLAAVDGDGQTPLQFLAATNRPEADLIARAQLLIARGASKTAASKDTPAAIAAKQHMSKLAAVLE